MKGDLSKDRRNALRGLLYGAKDFIPERDLAVMLGLDVTAVQTELRAMELDGLTERERRRIAFKAKPGSMNAWRLKSSGA